MSEGSHRQMPGETFQFCRTSDVVATSPALSLRGSEIRTVSNEWSISWDNQVQTASLHGHRILLEVFSR